MIKRGLSGGIRQVLANSTSGENPNPVDDKPVDNNIRLEWNKYVDWLARKGMRGSEELDKDDLGGKMIDAYRKENPSTPISRELIPAIQKEFSRYRDWSLGEIKAKRASFAEGTNPENYMKHLSKIDGYAGSRTTSFSFPSKYLEQFNNGQKVATINEGFATSK